MLHQVIETLNARVALRSRYDNFIGGKWVAPVDGGYFDNISPITGKPVCQIARSQGADIELALDAAHKAKDAWGNMAPAKRAEILNRVADRMQENLQVLAAVETIDNGKPIRETSFADIPLAIDHFRYFAACVRAQARGEIAEMIGGQRDIGEGRLADRLAIVDGLDRGEHFEVLFHAVGDFVQDLGAFGRRRVAPSVLRLVGGVERKLDIAGLRTGDLTHRLAGDGADIVEILAVDRRDPFAADEIVVAIAQGDPRIQGLDDLVQHDILP